MYASHLWLSASHVTHLVLMCRADSNPICCLRMQDYDKTDGYLNVGKRISLFLARSSAQHTIDTLVWEIKKMRDDDDALSTPKGVHHTAVCTLLMLALLGCQSDRGSLKHTIAHRKSLQCTQHMCRHVLRLHVSLNLLNSFCTLIHPCLLQDTLFGVQLQSCMNDSLVLPHCIAGSTIPSREAPAQAPGLHFADSDLPAFLPALAHPQQQQHSPARAPGSPAAALESWRAKPGGDTWDHSAGFRAGCTPERLGACSQVMLSLRDSGVLA